MLDTHDYRREIKESFSWSSKASYPVQAGISNKSEDEIFISRSVNLSLGMLIKDVGQVTTVPGEGFGRRLNASGVVPLTSL